MPATLPVSEAIAVPKPLPDMPTVTFVWTGYNRIGLRLPSPKTKGIDDKERQRRERLQEANGGRAEIVFYADGTAANPRSAFSTNHPALIQYIRQNKDGRAIVEDLSHLPMRCAFENCDFKTTGSTQADRESLAQHMINAHAGDLYANDTPGDAE